MASPFEWLRRLTSLRASPFSLRCFMFDGLCPFQWLKPFNFVEGFAVLLRRAMARIYNGYADLMAKEDLSR